MWWHTSKIAATQKVVFDPGSKSGGRVDLGIEGEDEDTAQW